MKKTRKGFTLVELLIVVAILAALAATMTVSMSGATAKAKAASIVANVDACVKAVQEYYYGEVNGNPTAPTKTAENFIKEAIPRWGSFTADDSNIKYTINGTATNEKDWTLTVDFTGDTDFAAIATALGNIKGFDKAYKLENGAYVDDDSYALETQKGFKVLLLTGRILKNG